MATALPTLSLDPAAYPGGVGIWGALAAIYDTTSRPIEHGVHVHGTRSRPDVTARAGGYRHDARVTRRRVATAV